GGGCAAAANFGRGAPFRMGPPLRAPQGADDRIVFSQLRSLGAAGPLHRAPDGGRDDTVSITRRRERPENLRLRRGSSRGVPAGPRGPGRARAHGRGAASGGGAAQAGRGAGLQDRAPGRRGAGVFRKANRGDCRTFVTFLALGSFWSSV